MQVIVCPPPLLGTSYSYVLGPLPSWDKGGHIGGDKGPHLGGGQGGPIPNSGGTPIPNSGATPIPDPSSSLILYPHLNNYSRTLGAGDDAPANFVQMGLNRCPPMPPSLHQH